MTGGAAMNDFTRSGLWEDYERSVEKLKRLLDTLQRLGIQLHPESRLARYTSCLGRFGVRGYNPMADPDFNATDFSEGHRDSFELRVVCDQIAHRYPEMLASSSSSCSWALCF